MEFKNSLNIEQIQGLWSFDGTFNVESFYTITSEKGIIPSRFKVNSYATKEDVIKFFKHKYNAVVLTRVDYNTTANDLGERIARKYKTPETAKKEYSGLRMQFTNNDDLFIVIIDKGSHDNFTSIELYYPDVRETIANELDEWACSFKDPSDLNKVGFISLSGNYWDMEEVEVQDTPTIDFKLNYNDDFEHQKVTDFVNNGKRGLILLGGAAGSGKTNYLRWLMAHSSKKFVYMPANQISLMSSPSFINFALSDLKNCVLLMEDCEDALIDRTQMKGGEVQTILNLTDGIVGSALNLTIIGTYNTKDNIDKALFRKGRMLYQYDFTALDTHKANELSKVLGHNVIYEAPQVLSEIYNPEPNRIEKVVEGKFGFKIGA